MLPRFCDALWDLKKKFFFFLFYIFRANAVWLLLLLLLFHVFSRLRKPLKWSTAWSAPRLLDSGAGRDAPGHFSTLLCGTASRISVNVTRPEVPLAVLLIGTPQPWRRNRDDKRWTRPIKRTQWMKVPLRNRRGETASTLWSNATKPDCKNETTLWKFLQVLKLLLQRTSTHERHSEPALEYPRPEDPGRSKRPSGLSPRDTFVQNGNAKMCSYSTACFIWGSTLISMYIPLFQKRTLLRPVTQHVLGAVSLLCFQNVYRNKTFGVLFFLSCNYESRTLATPY